MPAHIAICGWNDNGVRLLRDLVRSTPRPSISIVSHPAPCLDEYSGQIVVFDLDPSTQAGLDAVGIDTADVAVILADPNRGRSQDIDARTILTILAIERARPEIYTIAELIKPKAMELERVTTRRHRESPTTTDSRMRTHANLISRSTYH